MVLCRVSDFVYCYAESHHAECYYAECHYAECHYAECHCAWCSGANKTTASTGIHALTSKPDVFLLLTKKPPGQDLSKKSETQYNTPLK